MKTKSFILTLCIALLLFTTGCAQQTQEQSTDTAVVLFKYTDYKGETIVEKSFEVKKGSNAFEAMKENIEVGFENYAIGPFIQSIEGVAAPEGYYFALYVNGSYAEKGIADYTIEENIIIEWKTQSLGDFPSE